MKYTIAVVIFAVSALASCGPNGNNSSSSANQHPAPTLSAQEYYAKANVTHFDNGRPVGAPKQ